MKNIIKNKFFIFFILIFSYCLLFSNSSKASAMNSFEDSNYGTVYYTLPTGYQSYVLFKDGGKYVLLYTDVEDVHWTCDTNGGYKPICCYTDNTCKTVANFYRTKYSNSEWNYSPVKQSDGTYLLDFANANFMTFTSFSNVTTFITSDANIYVKGKDELFFQLAPSTLYQIIQAEAERKTIPMTIVEILPLILVVVVSFLGLRKALRMLSTLLRRRLVL